MENNQQQQHLGCMNKTNRSTRRRVGSVKHWDQMKRCSPVERPEVDSSVFLGVKDRFQESFVPIQVFWEEERLVWLNGCSSCFC